MTDFLHITPCGGDCRDCEYFNGKRCAGCLENGGKCVHMWEHDCEIFACRTAHNAAFCGVCGEFPCERLKNTLTWDKDGIANLKRLGEEYRKMKGEDYGAR